MIDNISQIVDQKTYHTRKFSDNTVKINAYSPDIYRKLIGHLLEEKIIHSYQLKQEKAYRVVIRNLHHSTPTTDISELETKVTK
jgi:hypothetical protein